MHARTFLIATATGLLALGSVAAQAQTLRYAHFQPASLDAPKHAAALAFKAYVEAATGGSLEVEIYPASQLGNGLEVMEGLQDGTIQLGVVHDGAVGGYYEPFQVFAIPYLFSGPPMAWAVLDGPFGEEFADAMRDETGIRLMAYADNGIRHFTNNVRAVQSPDDMDGLKVRVMPSPLFQILVDSVGASPSVVPWPELPGALQQGVVDGQENGVTNIISASLYQYQQHISLDGHVYSLHAYMMNDDFFEGLTEEQQQAVLEGVELAKWIHRGMTSAQDMNATTILTDLGMTVTALTPEQVAAFRELAQPAVREWIVEEIGDEWVSKLFTAVDTYNAEQEAAGQ